MATPTRACRASLVLLVLQLAFLEASRHNRVTETVVKGHGQESESEESMSQVSGHAGIQKCPMRMSAPFQEFRFTYPANNCSACNPDEAEDWMSYGLFYSMECGGDRRELEKDLCETVSMARPAWQRFCLCATRQTDEHAVGAKLVASLAFTSRKECEPEECLAVLTELHAKRAQEVFGSSRTFGPGAIDLVAFTGKCVECSSGALDEEQQRDCDQLSLGLEGLKPSAIEEKSEWVASEELQGLKVNKVNVGVSVDQESIGTQTAPKEKGRVSLDQRFHDLLIRVAKGADLE